tara:strand:- start:1368 stop:2693 length:1326 start_codon:yes stop_codon:yes gene_type:complete
MGLLKEKASNYYSGNDLGGYQFTSLSHIVNNFMIGYVGEGKIIPKVKRTDVLFYAQRALQEFSYDTLKSIKSQEITLPPSSVMSLPQDYVNYVKLVWVDDNGIEHIIYPTSKTSNPFSVQQGNNEDYTFNHKKPNNLAEKTSTTLTQSSEVFNNSGGPFALSLIDSTGSYVADPSTLISIGMGVTGENVPLGTYITEFNGITAITNQSIPHGTYDLTFTLPVEITQDTDITFNNNTAIIQNANPNIVVGMHVYGDGVPSNTVITSISGTTVTFNNFMTVSAINTLTYILPNSNSSTWDNYESLVSTVNNENEDDFYRNLDGERYGLDPQHAQVNGSFYIDELKGKIHFSSNITGKIIILKYISDGLGTDEEMVVHKFAEEAMYKQIAYFILSTRSNMQEHLVARFKKEKFAETRKAKIRLSNIKLEELTQVLRGKSKQIKH